MVQVMRDLPNMDNTMQDITQSAAQAQPTVQAQPKTQAQLAAQTQPTPQEEMRVLIERMNEASDAYYNGRGELMTDYEWDALFDRLKKLEDETGEVLPDSPTHKVSEDAIPGQKERHEYPALSLAKTKKVEDLVKWAEGRPIWISWKLDGLTLVATYDDGRLTRVLTRGGGEIGTNITHLADAIDGLPKKIAEKGHLVIRGEAVISYADFEQFLMESDEEYANPRNLASGSLSLKDVEEVKRRRIRWIPFTLVHTEYDLIPESQNSELKTQVDESPESRNSETQTPAGTHPEAAPPAKQEATNQSRDLASWGGRMDFLQDLGFKPVEREVILHPDETSVEDAIARWTEKVTGIRTGKQKGNPENSGVENPGAGNPEKRTNSRTNPYPVDGLVITYDDTLYAATGSVTGHHATRAGYAFKWQDESADSVLDHIEWSCAASTITPVAVFEPVELEGTTVQRASLCNISECERLGIGGPGTELSVIKANKIIPKVIRVIRPEGRLEIPKNCPVCGAQTEIRVNEASETRTLRCTNPACAAKQLKKFTRFVSKTGMDIDGISEQTLARFINAGWVREYADLYHLPEHREEIVQMEGFGEKSMENLAGALAKSRQAEPNRLLFALCIPLCGQEVAKLLLSRYALPDLIRTARGTEDPEVFSDISGIGPEKSASFVRWMQEEENAAGLDRLLAELTFREEDLADPGDPASAAGKAAREAAEGRCAGLTFVVTGDVHHYKNRNELKAYIESQGGKVTGAVSGSTSFLINNDVNSTSGKNQKAKKLGIPIISEDEFVERFV